MIRIQRTLPAPAALQAGEALVQAMHQAVEDRPGVAGGKDEPFEFDNKVYGAAQVKDALIAMQHGKCAYCEGDFRAFSYGDTEHQRPKAYSQQDVGEPTIRPGYYWLAYTWSNLVLSCERCNRSRKKNLFPLSNPDARATTPDAVANEQPLLVDPTGEEDPRAHIRFENNVPTGVSEIGWTTIECLDLDRIELNGVRLRHLHHVRALQKLVRAGLLPEASPEAQADGADAAAELEQMVQAHEPFSAMVLDALGR